MKQIHPQFITDDKGNKLSVVLPMSIYNEMVAQLEELEDIRAYDKAKSNSEDTVPLEEAFQLVEARRNRKVG